MEKTSADNIENLASDSEKEEANSSGSPERREKRKIFFLTRSLAEVYVEQSHINLALEVYRRMQDKNPTDPEIGKRIVELEENLLSKRGVRFKEQNT